MHLSTHEHHGYMKGFLAFLVLQVLLFVAPGLVTGGQLKINCQMSVLPDWNYYRVGSGMFETNEGWSPNS